MEWNKGRKEQQEVNRYTSAGRKRLSSPRSFVTSPQREEKQREREKHRVANLRFDVVLSVGQ